VEGEDARIKAFLQTVVLELASISGGVASGASTRVMGLSDLPALGKGDCIVLGPDHKQPRTSLRAMQMKTSAGKGHPQPSASSARLRPHTGARAREAGRA